MRPHERAGTGERLAPSLQASDARGDFDRDYHAWYGELFPSLAKAHLSLLQCRERPIFVPR